jgi:pimeloyl-ACP methyl ester carboxylesterase
MSTDTAPSTVPAADDGIERVQANGIEIAYETFGDPSDPTILLVMGLGTQMLAWPDELCEGLAGAGHHVIRYDNRDVGLSTHLSATPPPLHKMLLKRDVPYTVQDMADDGIGLVDALGIERFHLVGASMGGFISQTIALTVPDRVQSMTLIMTSTGSRRVGRPTPAVMRRLASSSAPADRAAALDDAVAVYRVIGSKAHFDEARIRELAGISYDRSNDPSGRQRQLAAILAQPDRTAALKKLRIPTLVVHGLDDPLVSVTGGLALAKTIPGATFIGHSGMGHDLPRTIWQPLQDDVLAIAAKAELEGASA